MNTTNTVGGASAESAGMHAAALYRQGFLKGEPPDADSDLVGASARPAAPTKHATVRSAPAASPEGAARAWGFSNLIDDAPSGAPSDASASSAALPPAESVVCGIQHNTDVAMAVLGRLDSKGRHDLAAIPPDGGPLIAATFLADERAELRAWIEAHQGKWNLYYSVNEAKPDARRNHRLGKADIGAVRAIPLDLDPEKVKGGEPTGEHFWQERKRLRGIVRSAADDPKGAPTWAVDSGGGYQPLWLLKDPLPATSENVELVEGIGRALKTRFGGDSTWDINRLMRLPGTVNLPNALKRAQGRQPALATVLTEESKKGRKAFTIEELTAFAPPEATQSRATVGADKYPMIDMGVVQDAIDYDDLPADLRTRFQAACDADPALGRLWHEGDTALLGEDTSASAYAFALPKRLREAGTFTATEFGQLLWVWECGPDHTKIDARYIARAWARTPARDTTANGFDDATETVAELEAANNVVPWPARPVPRAPSAIDMPAAKESPAQAKKRRLYFLKYDEACDQALESGGEPLIAGLLDVGAMSVWYGESNVGKTFVMLNAAWHIAAGLDWAGMKVRRGAVVYVAAEGGGGILKRLRALRARYPKVGEVPLVVVPCPVDLGSKNADTKLLLELIREAEAVMGVKVELVVIDTLSRALAGGNENDSSDMGHLVGNLDAIRVESKAHLAVVHHTGKDKLKGARGHSLLRAATDTEIEIDANMLTVTKQRDMEGALKKPFTLIPIALGANAAGVHLTSCTVDMREDHAAREAAPTTKAEDEIIEAIDAALGEDRKPFGWEFVAKCIARIDTGIPAIDEKTLLVFRL
jgi:hypothetical protein